MSKYEPRADKIKAEAAALGIKVSWLRQGSSIFVRVEQEDINNTFVAGVTCNQVRGWLAHWYPGVRVSSWCPSYSTFKVYDTWELLKANSNDQK